MIKIISRTTLVLFLLFGITYSLYADSIDDQPEVVTLYTKGKRLMREGAWLEASKTFQELAGRFPDSKNLDLFVFHRAKADYYFGNYNDATAGFIYYISRFPDASEIAHTHFFLGNIFYRKHNNTKALQNYIDAYRLSSDNRLTDLVRQSIKGTIKNSSSLQLKESDFEDIPSGKRCEVVEIIVETLLELNLADQARHIETFCDQKLDFGDRFKNVKNLPKDEYTLALVLPLSGELQTFGNEIYNGAVVAAYMANRDMGLNLKLETYDTEGDDITAARIIENLNGTGTDVVIGPLTSEEASVVSASLSCANLPVIIPAATQAGLTTLSSTSFQLSPNIELEGIRMAEYAFSTLKADSAAIITSTRAEHLRMARAFSDRFEQLGGEVIAIEYYRAHDKDFGPYVQDIKAMILGTEPDSTYFINETGDTLDFDGIPARVDCFFMPGGSNQLRLLLAQMNFYNLIGHYLGTDGWGDQDVYKLGDDITKGVVFPSPFLSGARGEDYLRFAALFDTRYGYQPQRLSNLGYDAVKLAASAIVGGGTNRETFVENLKNIRRFEGASGLVTFGENRENIEMPLYTIEGNEVILLGEREDNLTSENPPEENK